MYPSNLCIGESCFKKINLAFAFDIEFHFMKIAYVINYLGKGGPVNVLYNIVSHLDLKKHQVYIFRLRDKVPQFDRTPEFEALGAQVIAYDYPALRLELGTYGIAKKMAEDLDKLGIDIVHAHGYHPALVLAHLKGKFPTVNTFHNICKEDFILQKGFWMGNYMVRRYLRAVDKIDTNVAISRYMRQFYAKLLPGHKVELVYNGVEVPALPSDKERQKLRIALQLPSDKKIILVVGALSFRKNVTYSVRELCKVNNEKLKFVFLGVGKMMEKCKEFANDDNRFEFRGKVDNVVGYMAAANLLLSSSLSEGMPMAVLEASMAGLPVLLSDIPAHREVVELVYGNAEHLFNHGKVGALAGKLQTGDFFAVDKAFVQEQTAHYFASQVMADGYMKIYQRILQEG